MSGPYDCDNFIERLRAVEFGGYLSVRRDMTKAPIIVLGQDECIYKQFIFHNKRIYPSLYSSLISMAISG